MFMTGIGCHFTEADAIVFSNSQAVQSVEIMELKPDSQIMHNVIQ
jgi:hypothetical protein